MSTYEARVLARARRCPNAGCGRVLAYSDGEGLFSDYLYCDHCFTETYDPVSGIKIGEIE